MLSKQTETQFLEYLVFLAEFEKRAEILRQVLCEVPAFEAYQCFLRLDETNSRSVAWKDIQEFLRANNVPSERKELERLVSFHDANEDGLLSFIEFLHLVLPQDNPGLRTAATQRPTQNEKGRVVELDYEVEYALTRLIQGEIDFGQEISERQCVLSRLSDFSVTGAFELIDLHGLGMIDYNNLADYLKRKRVPAKDEDVVAVIRRLDRDDDGRVSLNEFCSHFSFDRELPIEKKKNHGFSPSKTSQMASLKLFSPERSLVYGSPARSGVQTIRPEAKQVSPIRQSESSSKKKGLSEYLSDISGSLKKDERKNTTRQVRRMLEKSKGASGSKGTPSLDVLTHEEVLVRFFKETIEAEKELEFLKRELATQMDFNMLDLFRFFDEKGEGVIGLHEVQESLGLLGIKVTRDEVWRIVRRFSNMKGDRLSFSDFSNIFNSIDREHYEMVASRKGYSATGVSSLGQVFMARTIEKVRVVLEKSIEVENAWGRICDEIQLRKMDLVDLFLMFDLDQDGFVELADVISSFLLKPAAFPAVFLNELTMPLE